NRFDRESEKFKRYTTIPNNPNSVSHRFVYSFAEDRSGNIWLGTFGGGLNKFDHNSEQFTHYRAAAGNANRSNGTGGSNRLSSDFIFSVTIDGDGIIWMGTNGAGLDRFDPETGKVTNYPAFPRRPSGLNNGFIRALHLDPSGVLWAGTIGGGLNKFDRETGTVTAYYLSEAGNPRSLGGIQVQDLFEDKDGFLWVGTADGGLNKFDRRTGRFTRYLNRPNDPTSLSSNIIMCIYQEPSGIFWIGTFGGGLNKFDAQKEIFTQYREKHGLPNDTVYGVLRDDDGFLWVSTNKGLSKFDPRVGSFRNYTPHDGLQGNEFNGAAFYESRAGKMFFGGVDGFNVFSPRDIKDNKNIPPIVITGFQIFNQPVGIGGDSPLEKDITETKEIVLPYKINVFSFNFVALDYTIPEKNQFKYMMEGFDGDWLSTGASKRFATYTNLDPGDYVFRVKGSNNDGVWNEEGTAIKIVITPPFWKTWWFRVLVGLLAAALALLLHKVMKRNIARTTRMQTELQTARTAQMSIMPQSDPQIEGFHISGICVPAYEVGGDFFDYFWLNPGKTKFGIAIGDVSGKAMKAAMTAVMSSGMIYSRIYSVTSVKETMTQVNHPLFLKTDKKMFTALCLASLDINTKEFVFTNAGLSEPLLKSQGKAVYIESTGPRLPLGSFRDNTYQETSLQLKTSDVVVLFTDGIPDSRNENGEFYGYGTLKKLVEKMDTASLSAAEIKEAIIGDVKRFSGAVPQQDDMTVVVIKFQL
ncbi:MAG: SpoIIE family protein phosphatase, partial [bacterium]|nr:SpoIIE family protein phosphatase [bacterium]